MDALTNNQSFCKNYVKCSERQRNQGQVRGRFFIFLWKPQVLTDFLWLVSTGRGEGAAPPFCQLKSCVRPVEERGQTQRLPAEPLRSKKPGGKGIWPGSSSFRGAEAGQLLVASFSRRCFRAIFGERGVQPPFLPGAAGPVCAGSALFAAKGLRHDEMQASPRKSTIWQRLGQVSPAAPFGAESIFRPEREDHRCFFDLFQPFDWRGVFAAAEGR